MLRIEVNPPFAYSPEPEVRLMVSIGSAGRLWADRCYTLQRRFRLCGSMQMLLMNWRSRTAAVAAPVNLVQVETAVRAGPPMPASGHQSAAGFMTSDEEAQPEPRLRSVSDNVAQKDIRAVWVCLSVMGRNKLEHKDAFSIYFGVIPVFGWFETASH